MGVITIDPVLRYIEVEILPRGHAALSEQRPLEVESMHRITVKNIGGVKFSRLSEPVRVDQNDNLDENILLGVCALVPSQRYTAAIKFFPIDGLY